MSASINLHGVSSMKADQYSGASWLQVETEDGDNLSIFMSYDTAKAIADTFNATFHEETAE